MGIPILCTEIFSVIFTLIMVYGLLFETIDRTEKIKAFIRLCLSVIVINICDGIKYIPIDWSLYPVTNFIITLVTFVGPFFVNGFFIRYVYLVVNKKQDLPYKWFSMGIHLCKVFGLATLAGSFSGITFIINDGIYEVGKGYNLYLLSSIFLIVYITALVLGYRKKIGHHDSIAVLFYVCFPVLCTLINLINEDLAFTVPSIALSLQMLNTLLHGEKETALAIEEKRQAELARMDELTGLSNRLAYTEKKESLSGDDSLGVIFCDINGLKFTNDNFGHEQGDMLIKNFAGVLNKYFRKNEIFRISGDEFVILMPGVSEKSLESRALTLMKDLMNEDKPYAAVGYSFGTENDRNALITVAEKNMYADKVVFYKRHPEYVRK